MRLSSSSFVMASARTSCSERSAKRFTAASLFRTTINKEQGRAMRQKKSAPPKGRRATTGLGGRLVARNTLAVRDRRKRSRDKGIAKVDGRAPMESPLALEEIDEKGKHGGHRIRLLCSAQSRTLPPCQQVELGLISHARRYVHFRESLRNGPRRAAPRA